MEFLKICIILTALALMARHMSRYLLAGSGLSADLTQWIARLHLHWIVIVWILYLLPFHPFSLILAASTLFFSRGYVRQFPLVTLVFLVLTIPTAERKISGVMGIESLIFFGWPLAISLVIFFIARSRPGKWRDFFRSTRWLYTLLLLFILILSFRETSFTDAMRTGLNYFALFFLTAGIVSKSKGEQWIAGVVYAIIAVGLLTAFISIFEFISGWLLFAKMFDLYSDFPSPISFYKYRNGMLRSLVALGNLQTGLILSTSAVMLVLVRRQVATVLFAALFGILASGLLLNLSRGPVLVGCAIVLIFELFRSRSSSMPKSAMFIGGIYVVLALTGALDFLQGMFELKDDFNFNYRVQLFDESVKVIMQNFLFGSETYIQVLASRGLMQGEGIVDIVNTYLQIGLEYGGVALALYILLLLTAMKRSMARIAPSEKNPHGTKEVDIYWLAITGAMASVFMQSSSVSVLGYTAVFVLILSLVLVSGMSAGQPSKDLSSRD